MEITVSAKTVEEAVALGASKLGKTPDTVTYEIIEEGKKGILGLGSREATVKVSFEEAKVEAVKEEPKPAVSGSVEEKVLNYINTIISGMGAQAEARIARVEENLSENGTVEKDICINIEGKGLGMLIGRHGDVLDSLQYLCNIVVGRFPKNPDKHEYIRVVLDIENYRVKRADTLKALARKMADRVYNSGRNFTLEPMSSYERRIIHSELQNYKGVHTYSVGSENDRRVVIAYGDEE